MLGRGVLLAFFALVIPTADGCTRGCTEIGCTDSAAISGEISKPTGPMVIEACFNDVCQQKTWDVAAEPNACAHLTLSIANVSICFPGEGGSGNLGITGEFFLGQTPPQDGDHYVLVFSDEQSGTVLGGADHLAHYADFYPNGKDCDTHPCKNTQMKVSPK